MILWKYKNCTIASKKNHWNPVVLIIISLRSQGRARIWWIARNRRKTGQFITFSSDRGPDVWRFKVVMESANYNTWLMRCFILNLSLFMFSPIIIILILYSGLWGLWARTRYSLTPSVTFLIYDLNIKYRSLLFLRFVKFFVLIIYWDVTLDNVLTLQENIGTWSFKL